MNEQPRLITQEEFEQKIINTWGLKSFNAVKDTIKPCECGGPLCLGWKLDVDTLVKAQK